MYNYQVILSTKNQNICYLRLFIRLDLFTKKKKTHCVPKKSQLGITRLGNGKVPQELMLKTIQAVY